MLKIKTFFKKHLSFFYPHIRQLFFNFYLLKRTARIKIMKEKEVTTFSCEGISFPIIVKKQNGFVDQEIFWKGCYEEEVLFIIKKNLPKDGVFVDIGANIGDHTLFAAHIAPYGKVIAFEPVPYLYDQIMESLHLPNQTNLAKIFVHNTACGEKEQTLTIQIPKDNAGGASFLRETGDQVVVKSIPGDTILIKEDRIDIIKIDTEGFELKALLGIEETIKKHRPKIILELSPSLYRLQEETKNDTQKILTFFEKHYYYAEGIDEKLEKTTNLTSILDRHFEQVNLLLLPS